MVKIRFAGLWLFALVLQMVYWFPWHLRVIKTGLDNSFRYALNDLFANRVQFASECMVQYGPYGFLKNDLYHPETVHLLLLVRLLLFVVFAALVARASDRLGMGWGRAVLWTLGLVTVARFGEPYFLTMALLAFVVFWLAEGAEERLVWSPVAFVLALAALMQFTYALLGVAVMAAMVLVVVDETRSRTAYARTRRGWEPLLEAAAWPVLFALGMAFLWVAAGQELDGLVGFVTGRLRLTATYSSSHSLAGPWWQVAAFAIGSTVFWGVFTGRRVRPHGGRALGAVLLLGMVLFLGYKHAFVRHDPAHASYGAFTGICVVMIFAPLMLHRWDDSLRRLPRWTAVAATMVMLGASALLLTYDRHHWYGAKYFRHLDLRTTAGRVLRAVTDPDFVEFRHQRAMRRIRRAEPVPKLRGTVDVYPWEMSLAYAHGFDLRSRPTLQSYQASDPLLAGINARHLLGDDAPDHLLFRVAAIDQRFPASEDGLSWPQIIAGYRLRTAGTHHLVLDRTGRARKLRWREPRTQDLSLGQRVAIDHPANRLLWVRFEPIPTVAGRLTSVLHRTPSLWLRVSLVNGDQHRYRVVPGMARAGFLLSPLVDDARAFASLLDRTWSFRLADARVESIVLESDSGVFWRSPISLELREFSVD